jgi:antitoxin PrlF
MATATMTSKGQFTLPKEVRERLGLHPGDKLEFVFSPDGRLEVRPRTIHVEKLFGLLHRKGEKAATLEEIDAGIAAGAAKGGR